MRVTFDSNAWEAVFTLGDQAWSPIRAAIRSCKIKGFICVAGFRIEAIAKKYRPTYFSQPHIHTSVDFRMTEIPGQFSVALSVGPDNDRHPGIPAVQLGKLNRALSAGVKLIYGQNWMGLPTPTELNNPSLYALETRQETNEREGRQTITSMEIDERGLGHTAFLTADGWTDRTRTQAEEKKLSRACAEWADGEIVAAHIAYQFDVLCTNDRAMSAGQSIFDSENRIWLKNHYNVEFLSLHELLERVLDRQEGGY